VLYPLSYEGTDADRSPRRYDLPMAPVSVLVVDDDPVIQRLLQVNFELEGIDVTIAVDGEEGLAAAKASPPDVLISDIMMPKLNGLELLAALRSTPKLKDLPIILLSAKAQVADVQRGMELGADDYVTKPFDPLELIDRVYKVLNQSRR
jgi:DNA-binding response OmpR family regulator